MLRISGNHDRCKEPDLGLIHIHLWLHLISIHRSHHTLIPGHINLRFPTDCCRYGISFQREGLASRTGSRRRVANRRFYWMESPMAPVFANPYLSLGLGVRHFAGGTCQGKALQQITFVPDSRECVVVNQVVIPRLESQITPRFRIGPNYCWYRHRS